MLQMKNVEPRRSWHRPKYQQWWTDPDGEQPWLCTTCGNAKDVTLSRGAPFCRECLEWSRQANLDEDFDDLGMPG